MTPTSATGAEREAGFTLVELMVALFVMGLIGGAILLAVPNGQPRLSDEAEALAARLKRAQEEAVLTNRTVDVTLTREGYRFRTVVRGRWAEIEEPPFAPRAWGEGVSAVLETPDGRTSLRFDPTGGADPGIVSLARQGQRIEVRIDEAGKVSLHAPPG